MGLVDVDVRMHLQKIDKGLRDVGGEGLQTKMDFKFKVPESNSPKPKRN
jgi:hypothetical protein